MRVGERPVIQGRVNVLIIIWRPETRGEGAWESNPPGRLVTPHNSFEVWAWHSIAVRSVPWSRVRTRQPSGHCPLRVPGYHRAYCQFYCQGPWSNPGRNKGG